MPAPFVRSINREQKKKGGEGGYTGTTLNNHRIRGGWGAYPCTQITHRDIHKTTHILTHSNQHRGCLTWGYVV